MAKIKIVPAKNPGKVVRKLKGAPVPKKKERRYT